LGFIDKLKKAAEKNGANFILNAEVLEIGSGYLKIKRDGVIKMSDLKRLFQLLQVRFSKKYQITS